jgi:hypothetical protein
MIVADFFIWRSWATSLTHYAGDIQGSSLGLGIAAAATAGATAILGTCILKRNASLRDNKPPHKVLLRTTTGAIIAVGAATITAILLGR